MLPHCETVCHVVAGALLARLASVALATLLDRGRRLIWEAIVKTLEPPEELLTPEEVASRLKLAVRTVQKWAQKGVIPAHPIGPGASLRMRWSEVSAALGLDQPR